jgi:hypothetical protein
MLLHRFKAIAVRLVLVSALGALALSSSPARGQVSAPEPATDEVSVPAPAAEAEVSEADVEPATPAEKEVISDVRQPDGYMRMVGTSGAAQNCGDGRGARSSLALLENSSADGHCR